MAESNDEKKRLEKSLDESIDNREFEIDLLWRRALAFWGFIGAIFVAIGALYKNDANLDIIFLLSLAGVIFSFVWVLVNKGSKSWQESWEIKAEFYFEKLYSYEGFYDRINKDEKTLSWRYSLSRLLIRLSEVTFWFWILMTIYIANQLCGWVNIKNITGFWEKVIVVIMFLGALLICYLIWDKSKSADVSNGDPKYRQHLVDMEDQRKEETSGSESDSDLST